MPGHVWVARGDRDQRPPAAPVASVLPRAGDAAGGGAGTEPLSTFVDVVNCLRTWTAWPAGWSGGYEQAQLIEPARVRPAAVLALNETEPPADVISTVAGTASMAYFDASAATSDTVMTAGYEPGPV